MDVVFDNIPALFVFTVVFLILYTVLLNIYFIHKNGFRVSVNCWFCNKNSKVLYANRNSFECPHCSQYNGFDEKGDYNKIIEAQHNPNLNNSHGGMYQQFLSSSVLSNALCDRCNTNQQLKVLQLAKYEPLNEKNYDIEIEHFEKQLEKTYNLCKSCVKTLKTTIRKQNAWIFGNRLKNNKKTKGLSYIKLNKHSQGKTEDIHGFYNFSFIRFLLLIMSILNLLTICGFEIVILKDILPKSVLPRNVIFSDIYSTLYNVTLRNYGVSDYFKYLPEIIKTKELTALYISFVGVFFEILFSFVEKKWTFCSKCNKVLSWVILGLTATIHFNVLVKTYINTLQLFCSIYLLYCYGTMCLNLKERRSKEYKLKYFKRQLDDDYDVIDDEDSNSESINNTKVSYQTAINKNSPGAAGHNNTLNQTFVPTPSLNSSIMNNVHHNTNTELNQHFHSLNLGAFEPPRPMSCQSFYSSASTNPFLNVKYSQSPSSLFNVNASENRSFSNRPQNNLFKFQNSPTKANNSFSEQQSSFLLNSSKVGNNSYVSPKNASFNGHTRSNPEQYIFQNKAFNSFIPSETSSVHPDMTVKQSSPIYSSSDRDLSQKCFRNSLNESFRPLSPISTAGKSNRSLLSPPKLNRIRAFNSDARENENLNLSFQSENLCHSSSVWPKVNTLYPSSNFNQSIIVNSLTKVQSPAPHGINGSFLIPDKNISRSSSSSSGFVSNGEFSKLQASSLPNSRDHSPDRNSLLSEPAFHYKLD